ncbi:hypothetical protein [Nonomuraea sp. NPDC049480]
MRSQPFRLSAGWITPEKVPAGVLHWRMTTVWTVRWNRMTLPGRR